MQAICLVRTLIGMALACIFAVEALAQSETISSAICREIAEEAKRQIERRKAVAEVCANSRGSGGLCHVNHGWCASKVEELDSRTAKRLDDSDDWEDRFRYPPLNLLRSHIQNVRPKDFDKNRGLIIVIALWRGQTGGEYHEPPCMGSGSLRKCSRWLRGHSSRRSEEDCASVADPAFHRGGRIHTVKQYRNVRLTFQRGLSVRTGITPL